MFVETAVDFGVKKWSFEKQDLSDVEALLQSVPNAVTVVLKALHQAGFEAYLVGGCVRDHFLVAM